MADLRTLTVRSTDVPGRAVCDPGGLDLPLIGRTSVEIGARVSVLLDGSQGVILGPVRDAAGDPIPDPGGGAGVTEHGALSGLADDDHAQYLTVERLSEITPRIYAVSLSVTFTAQNVRNVDVAFPPGLFTAPPACAASITTGDGLASTMIIRPRTITANGCNVLLNTVAGANVSGTATFDLIAVERSVNV